MVMVISATEADPLNVRQLIDRWFTDYHIELSQHLDRYVDDPHVSEDLLQDTFIQALKSVDATVPPANPRAWLYRIATNRAIDYLRRQRRWNWLLRYLPTDHADIEHHIVNKQQVRRSLAALKPQDAEVLILVYHVGLSPADVANTTGEPLSTIRKRLSRARDRFRHLHTTEADQ